jgi:hypothetical protein
VKTGKLKKTAFCARLNVAARLMLGNSILALMIVPAFAQGNAETEVVTGALLEL